MASLQSKILAAQKAGYSDDEIFSHISSMPEYKQKTKAAIDEGYKPSEILSYLAGSEAKKPKADAIPQQRQQPAEPSMYERARPYVAPLVEGGAGIAGALIAAPAAAIAGPIAPIAGGALGYGIGSQAMELADVLIGGRQPRPASEAALQAAQNLSTGALMEAGGPAVVKGIGELGKGAAQVAGRVANVLDMKTNTARKIAKNALGDDLPAVLNALKAAPEGESVSMATADINSPVWQSLISRAMERDPRFLNALQQSEGEVSINALANLAKGATATETRAAQEAAKAQVNEQLIPVLKTEMEAANIAGRELPRLQDQADVFGEIASKKVDDVKRFEAATERAVEKGKQKYPVPGMPRMPFKYTYEKELADRAQQVSQEAAEGSLAFGEARRFSQAAADSLAAYGLKPLKAESVISSVQGILKDPKLAGNKEISRSVSQVAKDIRQWTNENGVIDAWALDAIRKNSVNSVIKQMYPAATKSQQKELAQGVLSSIKPKIVAAIEEAGGTGYGQYLRDYAKEMSKVAETKLAGKALELFKNDKDGFVKLVQGESPEQVEKILGPGSYDIAKEVSENTMNVLREQAERVLKKKSVDQQASMGQQALAELLKQNISKFRLPSFFNPIVTSTNAALDKIEAQIGKGAMKVLTESFKSAKGTTDLLQGIPPTERNKILRVLDNPELWTGKAAKAIKGKGVGVATGATLNQMAPPVSNRNSMNDMPLITITKGVPQRKQ